jgi:hypothetical protein
MTIRFNPYLIIALILFLLSCSSEQTVKKEYDSGELEELHIQDVKIFVNKIYSWVNLMPGSESRFHITGDFDLLESTNYDINSVKLKSIIIYQGEKEIYRITPTVKELELDPSLGKNITFSTIKGLTVHRELNIEEKINIELIFYEGGDELVYKLDNININKAY